MWSKVGLPFKKKSCIAHAWVQLTVKKFETIKMCITKYNNQLKKQNSNCINMRKDMSYIYKLYITHIPKILVYNVWLILIHTTTCMYKKYLLYFKFLGKGESFRSLAFGYRISPSAISKFVLKVLTALQKQFVPLFLSSLDQINCNQKAGEFMKRWDFPNCVAAIDGKHMRIVAPSKSGSIYFNFKGFFFYCTSRNGWC